MASCFHHYDDEGTSFGFVIRDCNDALVDLSPVGTVVTAFLMAPSGAVSSGPATIVSPGTEGRATYVRATEFGLTEVGLWRRWARAAIPGVGDFTSSPVSFYVHNNEAA